ncbi:MAG: hypothetical protein OXQ84_21345 [bacterium]|nr:hypothetical protein [bacterium]
MTTRFLIMIVSATLMLAACGGGGGRDETPTGNRETIPDPESPDIIQPNSAPNYSSLRQAANSIPLLGRRSVTQSSNMGHNNTTTDTVEAIFDHGQFAVTITQEDGARIVLDSVFDTVSTNAGTPIRTDQTSREWKLEKQFPGHTMTVFGFGEISDGDFPLRAIRAAGNYATNKETVEDWEASGRSMPLVPLDYIEWLKSLHVNQVGLSIGLRVEDSLDSTVERSYSGQHDITFSDDAIRQFIREFKEHGIDIYLTLAFETDADYETAERSVFRWQLGDPGDATTGVPSYGNIMPQNWPWRPDHPDHARFVAEFWQTFTNHAVHFAQIAQEEGVRIFSLGTETDNLFRTRSDPPGGYWTNHFASELRSMVRAVREVYSGFVTYDMHYSALTANEHYGTGSNSLWEDLDLDIVGVSAYFEVADAVPTEAISVADFEKRYQEIFREHLLPLAERNPGRPIVFLEYGVDDTLEGPLGPGGTENPPFEYQDANGNGLDDGREMQANMYQALINTMQRFPGLVEGVLWTENWIASDQKWAEHWGQRRGYSIRNKPSEDVVRAAYESWAEWLTGGHWMQVSDDGSVDAAGAFVDAPELAGRPTLPTIGTASYQGIATGGYVLVYGGDFFDVSPGSHEIGDYEGGLELTADFTTGHIDGRVHSIEVSGMHTPVNGGTRSFNGVSVPYEMVLETTTFNSGGFTGNTSVTSSEVNHGIADSKGSWGGKFSTISNSDGSPRLIAGTHGAEFSAIAGSEGSFIGVFVGTTD